MVNLANNPFKRIKPRIIYRPGLNIGSIRADKIMTSGILLNHNNKKTDTIEEKV